MLEKFGLFIPKAHAQLTATCPNSTVDPISGTFYSTGYSINPLCPLNGENVTLGLLLDRIITLLLWGAGVAAVIYLLWAGILYITAGGDEAKAGKARTGIVNAVIGIVIIVLAFVIEKSVANVFGGQ
jgi:hypothetical protein